MAPQSVFTLYFTGELILEAKSSTTAKYKTYNL